MAPVTESRCAGPGLESLLYVGGDRVREWFVPTDMRDRPADQRWWSLTCHEDDERLGRRPQRRRRPRRESAEARTSRGWAQAPPAPVRLVPLAEAVAPHRAQLRARIMRLQEWALASGHPILADLVALLFVAMGDRRERDGQVLLTREDVADVLTTDVPSWAGALHTAYPPGMAEALWVYVGYLAASGSLHPASEPVDVLRAPLRLHFGLGDDGRPTGEVCSSTEGCGCDAPGFDDSG